MNLPNFPNSSNAIAIDIYGTLLNNKNELSQRNRQVIKKCISYGLPVIIATSRAERSVRRLIGDELTNNCSLVMLNGAIAKGVTPLLGHIRETIPIETPRDISRKIFSDVEAKRSIRGSFQWQFQ